MPGAAGGAGAFEPSERELTERLRQQESVLAIGEQALRPVPLPEFLQEGAKRVAETLGAPFAKALLLEPGGGALRLVAGVGWREGRVGEARVPADERSQAGFTLRSSGPVIVEDAREERRFHPPALLEEHGVRSGISVVLGDPEAPLGVLAVHSAEPRAFGESEARFLQSVANVVALALRRRQAEEVLRHSEARYRMLAENASDLIEELDDEGRIAFASPNHLEKLGWRPEALVGRDAFAFVHEADREPMRQAFRRALATGEPAEATLRVHTREGGVRYLEAHGRTVRSAERPGMVMVLRDVTARREAEAALRESEERLRRSQKLEAVGRLAGGIAHDFNNMLTVIAGYADLLASRFPEGHPDRTVVEEIRAAQGRAAVLTRQLLAFGRAQDLRPRPFDLNGLVRGMEPMLRSLAGEAADFALELDADVPAALADPAAVEQATVNLVLNARDALLEGGAIRVATTTARLDEAEAAAAELAPGRYAELAVRDEGEGMDAETLARVFEPFYSTKPTGSGSGLGLASVYGVVRQSEGGVLVESAPGAGATFRLFLPLAERSAALHDPPGPSAEPAATGTATVLLCEDDPAVRTLLARQLGAEGYTVIPQPDAEAALAFLREEDVRVDLLVTDVVMPGGSGPELASRARALRPGLGLLYVTGYADREASGRPGPEGERLAKPFSRAELRRAVRAALRARPPEPDTLR